MAAATALRRRSNTTMNITKKHSQIETSPKPLQNLLGLDTDSRSRMPLLVLIISIMPRALVASILSRRPVDSAYNKPEYQIARRATNQIGAPRLYTRNSRSNGIRMLLFSPCSAMMTTIVLVSSTCSKTKVRIPPTDSRSYVKGIRRVRQEYQSQNRLISQGEGQYRTNPGPS